MPRDSNRAPRRTAHLSSSSPRASPPPPSLPRSYNERFLALRDLKRRMLDHMHEEEGRLAEINAELGAPPPVPPPTSLEPEEEPERRMDVTDADIDEFTAKLEKEKATKGYGTDFGGLAATPAKGGAVAESPRAAAAAAPAAAPRTAMEEATRALRRARLEHERATLLDKRARSVASFDGALAELRAEKLRLEADLKTTDLRKLVLAQVTGSHSCYHRHHHHHHHHHHYLLRLTSSTSPPPPPSRSRRSWLCSSSSR